MVYKLCFNMLFLKHQCPNICFVIPAAYLQVKCHSPERLVDELHSYFLLSKILLPGLCSFAPLLSVSASV